MMSLLSRIFKEQVEHANGRINATTGGWVFSPSQSLIARTKACNPTFEQHGLISELDANGKEMFLVRQKSVICRNPEMGEPHPKFKSGSGYSVPHFVCKKCRHYRMTTREIRYPHCQWVKEAKGGTDGAVKETLGIFQQAANAAQELLK